MTLYKVRFGPDLLIIVDIRFIHKRITLDSNERIFYDGIDALLTRKTLIKVLKVLSEAGWKNTAITPITK
tara:strand:+ start:2269 stop:2478 length:210 start_codon:yes stop_codon:yes gene_type:complete